MLTSVENLRYRQMNDEDLSILTNFFQILIEIDTTQSDKND